MKRLALALLMTGCQTLMSPEDYIVRPQELSHFQSCETGEGTLKVKIQDKQYGGGRFDLDWISRSDGSLQAEAMDSLGISFLTMAGRGNEFHWGGRISRKMPSLDVDLRGYLMIKGHWLPLKFAEVPCLLKFQMPEDWKKNLTVKSRTPGRALLESSSEGRQIEIGLQYVGEALTQICAKISWVQWLVWRRNIQWCYELQSPVRGSLDLGASTKVDWEQ